jgi:hypothetical protein
MPHSEKSLFQLLLFRIALWTPIILAVLVAIYIIFTSDLTFESGFSGLNNALNIFKIPLAIFSLVFPSVALVTANHRSIQSKKQISLAQQNIELSIKQNTLKNYYDSINEFEKYLDSSTLQKYFVYKNKRILYRKFFQNNAPENVEFTINKKVLSKIKAQYQISVDNIIKDLIASKKQDTTKEVLCLLYKKLKENWLENYGLEIPSNININEDDKFSDVINNITNEFYNLLGYCIEYSQSETGIIISSQSTFLESESFKKFAQSHEVDTRFNSLFYSSSTSLMFGD